MYGPYQSHVRETLANKNNPNLLILFYEEMKADIMKQLNKINNFLGTNLTEQQLQNVIIKNLCKFYSCKDIQNIYRKDEFTYKVKHALINI